MSPRAAWRLGSLGFGRVFDYGAGKQDWFAAGYPIEGELAGVPVIADVMRTDVPTCGPGETVGAARALVDGVVFDRCLVVNEAGVVLGQLRVGKELGEASGATAETVMKPGPSTFRPNVSLEEMAAYMENADLPRGAVTTPEGVLLGEILRVDIARARGCRAGP